MTCKFGHRIFQFMDMDLIVIFISYNLILKHLLAIGLAALMELTVLAIDMYNIWSKQSFNKLLIK